MVIQLWTCPICTAGCTFEAMVWCAKIKGESDECGYDIEQPIALGGCFEFVVRNEASIALEGGPELVEQEVLNKEAERV